MKYKGILLDLDDTVYDYDFSHQKALTSVYQYAEDALNISKYEIENAFLTARKSINIELNETAASHNRMLYFQRMYERLNVNAQQYALRTYEIYWEVFLSHMTMYNHTIDFFEWTKDVPICLVTDLTAQIQHRKLNRLDIVDYIDFMVSSEESGREKPHPYIFMMALEKLGLKANEVIMIGDNFKKDMLGASALGIKSYWLNKKKESPNHLPSDITSIEDIIQLKGMVEFEH